MHGLEQRLDHRAASGHEHDLHARRAVGGLGVAGHLVIEDGLVEGHGDRLGRLEADRGFALLVVLDARKLDHAHHDLLVGDAEAHVLGQPLIGHEALEGIGERGGVPTSPSLTTPSGRLWLAERTSRAPSTCAAAR